ncbi:MAG: S-layer homology domain-containing protein, partial [Elusimicrobiales bacterium]|nr:S-layer homology domain-containing protein [Elusimicrobiales bacterium]
TDYYADSVQWAVENGITTGVTATTFVPNNTCTQAQILTFLWRSQGTPAASSVAPLGIGSDKYYYGAVNWAYENGIIDGSFTPNGACTRATAVDYIYKSQGSPAVNGSNAFTDVNGSDSYADAVMWAVENGVTTGVTSTTFVPDKTCTRAQIATFLYRALA